MMLACQLQRNVVQRTCFSVCRHRHRALWQKRPLSSRSSHNNHTSNNYQNRTDGHRYGTLVVACLSLVGSFIFLDQTRVPQADDGTMFDLFDDETLFDDEKLDEVRLVFVLADAIHAGAQNNACGGARQWTSHFYGDNDNELFLDTAIVRFERGPQVVDLVSIVHYADKEYFQSINRHLRPFDRVLFELITDVPDDVLKRRLEHKRLERQRWELQQLERQRSTRLFASPAAVLGEFILFPGHQLAAQFDHLDCTPDNMVRADVSDLSTAVNGFRRLWISRTWREFWSAEPKTEQRRTSGSQYFGSGRFRERRRRLAWRMVDTSVSDQCEADQNTLVIGGRNAVAMAAAEEFFAQRGARPTRVAVLYGAGHYNDFCDKLEAAGFKPTGAAWLSAIDLMRL